MLEARARRAHTAHHAAAARALAALSRVLDGISYRAVLARGFALVRGEGGAIRRRAAALSPGESLTLVFADGEAGAMAVGKAEKPGKAKKPPAGQGSLF
jgi:exodeoxyribonuclease VII large subunit